MTALEQAVYDNPADLDLRLILADECNNAGDVEGELFWRWLDSLDLSPVVQYPDGSYSWNWLKVPLPVRYKTPGPSITKAWAAQNAFQRLRIGFDRARATGWHPMFRTQEASA